MLLTGRPLTAHEALEWGLVNAVVPDDELDEETLRWARGIAMHSTDGLIIGKMQLQLVLQSMGMGVLETANFPIHALFTNIKWRQDELNFLKSRYTEGGTAQSFKARETKWQDKSGF
jgi:enoyl-CoA hydratase